MSTLLVAGGGTGGHVLAGVAIAEAWRTHHASDPRTKVLYVGARGGLEEKLVPRAGIPLILLRLGSLNQVSLGRKLKTAVQLPWAFLRSAVLLLKERPSAVVGVGGYASGPAVLAAALLGGLWGCRTAILEQNAIPGLTNRWLGKVVHLVFGAFPGIETYFPRSEVWITGNPVRSHFQPMPPSLAEPFTVFVFGGSQGALGINTLVLQAIERLGPDARGIRWIHQTGERDYERVKAGHERLASGARVEKFIFDMAECYSQASLLVCRAGSSTLAEIAAVGRASVLVPFPLASDNHQEGNARVLVDAGAARLLRQQDAKGEDLAAIIVELRARHETVHAMELAARPFFKPHAALDIVRFLHHSPAERRQ